MTRGPPWALGKLTRAFRPQTLRAEQPRGVFPPPGRVPSPRRPSAPPGTGEALRAHLFPACRDACRDRDFRWDHERVGASRGGGCFLLALYSFLRKNSYYRLMQFHSEYFTFPFYSIKESDGRMLAEPVLYSLSAHLLSNLSARPRTLR